MKLLLCTPLIFNLSHLQKMRHGFRITVLTSVLKHLKISLPDCWLGREAIPTLGMSTAAGLLPALGLGNDWSSSDKSLHASQTLQKGTLMEGESFLACQPLQRGALTDKRFPVCQPLRKGGVTTGCTPFGVWASSKRWSNQQNLLSSTMLAFPTRWSH